MQEQAVGRWHRAWGVVAAHEWTGEPENRQPRKHFRVRWVDANFIFEAFVETTASGLHYYLNDGS